MNQSQKEIIQRNQYIKFINSNKIDNIKIISTILQLSQINQ